MEISSNFELKFIRLNFVKNKNIKKWDKNVIKRWKRKKKKAIWKINL